MFKHISKSLYLVLVSVSAAVFFVGCDANNKSALQNQKIERAQQIEIAYNNAQAQIAALAKEQNTTSSKVELNSSTNLESIIQKTHDNLLYLQQLDANSEQASEVEKTQVANRNVSASVAGASAIAFEVKTIPDRIKLGLKILEAITQGSTQLVDVEQSYIDKFALKVTLAVIDMVNPLSDTKAMFASLDNAIKEVMNAPKQKDTDYANMHIRAKLDGLLHKFRFYKFNETKKSSEDVNAKLDEVVLRATGVRLNPFATVADIKNAITQVVNASEAAKQNQMPADFVTLQESKLTPEQVKASFEKLNKTFDLGIGTGKKLKSLIENFKTMKKETALTGIAAKINFDLTSIDGRIEVVKQVAKAIALGTGPYANKEQVAHTKLGFAATIALVDLLNPLSTSDDIKKSLAALDEAIKFLEQAPELKPTSIASVNYKERMAIQLRQYRDYQFNKFANKPYKKVEEFNYAILLATGVRLDPTATVQKVSDTLENLKKLVAEVEATPDMTANERRASFALKHKLLTSINKVFFADKSKVSKTEATVMDKQVWDARGIHLDINASVAKVNQTIEVLEGYAKQLQN